MRRGLAERAERAGLVVGVVGFVGVVGVVSACDDEGGGPPLPPPPVVSTLAVTKAGDGAGIVRTLPAGLVCDTTCTDAVFDYEDTAEVTVIAELGRKANFRRLRCSAEGQPDVVTQETEELDEEGGDSASVVLPTQKDGEGVNFSCEADFALVHTVQVLASNGSGAGRVTGALSASVGAELPKRIDCTTRRDGDNRILEGDPVGAYFDGETETLTATADPGSVFVDWDTCDVADPSNPVLVLDVDDDFNCRANFDLQ